MAQTSWMQPALQPNEAVLLPALERTAVPSKRHTVCRHQLPAPAEAFIPVAAPAPAVSPSQTHGSMAGRSVLRAAGVRTAAKGRCRRKR